MSDFSLGIQLMGMGLTGVFTVLILFYGTISLIMKLFQHK